MGRRVDVLVEMLCKLTNEVMKLQSTYCTIRKTSKYFNFVFQAYRTFEARFAFDGGIVQNIFFQSGAAKRQEREKWSFCGKEERSFCIFARKIKEWCCWREIRNNHGASIHTATRKRFWFTMKVLWFKGFTSYSIVCEKLFPIACYELTGGRKGTLPTDVEIQLFLFMHRDLWEVNDVTKVVQNRLGGETTLNISMLCTVQCTAHGTAWVKQQNRHLKITIMQELFLIVRNYFLGP